MNFEYNDLKKILPDDCTFRISPSQIEKFFSLPAVWYDEQILKNSQFEGNTATVLGTIVHAFAEEFAKGNHPDRSAAEAYLDAQTIDIDKDEIRSLYPDMAETLINEYVRHNMPSSVEDAVYTEIQNGIYVAGSCDNRTGDIVVDYKNVAKAPTGGNDGKIPFNYKIQMLAYAYCYRAMGIPIERIRLVYTVRPTKTLPIRVFVVTQVITPEDWDMISNTLNLMAETVLSARSNPELVHLLFKSYKLKGK